MSNPKINVQSVDDYTQPFTQADVVFVVEQKKLYFNRGMLAMHSPYFERMFADEWKASKLFAPDGSIPLPEKKFDDVLAMLKLLKRSPNEGVIVTDENVEALLQMADEYDLQHVAGECLAYVNLAWAEKPSCGLRGVWLGERFGFRELMESFIPYAAQCSFAEIRQFAPPILSAEAYAAILHLHTDRLHQFISLEHQSFAYQAAAGEFKCPGCGVPLDSVQPGVWCSWPHFASAMGDDVLAIVRKKK